MPRIPNRQRVVSIRLTSLEHATVQADAQAAGVQLAVWLRMLVLEGTNQRDQIAAIEARLAALDEAISKKPSIQQMQKFLDVYRAAAAKAPTPAPTPLQNTTPRSLS